jgi:hypothetical protein
MDAVVVCTGPSVKEYAHKLPEFCSGKVTIGINNCTEFFRPDYHLFTNTKRFQKYSKNINPKKGLIVTDKIERVAREVLINVTKDWMRRISIVRNTRDLRTAGLFAIRYAIESFGVDRVFVVGMDGYCFPSKHTHAYGPETDDGLTSQQLWEKDLIISRDLDRLEAEGCTFGIVTPTIYFRHYQEGII